LYVYCTGVADISLGLETYKFQTWLNTINPIINVSYFLVGICIKKQFIDLKKINFRVGFSTLCIVTLFDIYVGHLMIVWLPVLAIIFTLCLNYNSKNLFLGRVITLIGKRTYGIFFAHFLFLQSPLLLEFYDRFNITGFGLLFKILDFFIVLFLSLIVAIFSYELIEKPFMKISNYVEKGASPNNK
jgi:peptidoglycan/LPS O-acetylase OafA/YrhL